MTQSKSIICDRAFEFASRALKLSDRLHERGPSARHIASQMIRCWTSIGANAEESQEAQSKADFVAKLSVSRKEARDATYWLRLAVKNEIVGPDEIKWELNEARQLLAMIRSAILTARSSESRGPSRST
jgi:four helix bundle protein